MKLHKYQNDIVSKVLKSVKNGNKHVLIQSPAGSGKTVMMAALAKMTTDQGKHVLFMVHRKEICQQVFKTFSDFGVNMSMCHVSMKQTISNHPLKYQADLILCDEAHHSIAPTYMKVFNSFPDAIALGFTATPWRIDGKGLGDVFSDLILGPEVQWLIDHGYLSPVKYYAPLLVDVAGLKSAHGQYTQESIDEVMNARMIYGDVIKNYQELADNTKTIVYTHDVKSANEAAQSFIDAGYTAKAVSGKTKKPDRAKIMQDFRDGKIMILVNAELYGEGVDVPDCETVIMLRPTESLTVDIQQSMRCMRFMPGKTATIIDHVANVWHYGIPTLKHEWSLDGTIRRNGDGEPKCKECPECGAIQQISERLCNTCHHKFTKKDNEINHNPFIELKRVKGDSVYSISQARQDCRKINRAETIYRKIKNCGGNLDQAFQIVREHGLIENSLELFVPKKSSGKVHRQNDKWFALFRGVRGSGVINRDDAVASLNTIKARFWNKYSTGNSHVGFQFGNYLVVGDTPLMTKSGIKLILVKDVHRCKYFVAGAPSVINQKFTGTIQSTPHSLVPHFRERTNSWVVYFKDRTGNSKIRSFREQNDADNFARALVDEQAKNNGSVENLIEDSKFSFGKERAWK